jgi:hypothetical protein
MFSFYLRMIVDWFMIQLVLILFWGHWVSRMNFGLPVSTCWRLGMKGGVQICEINNAVLEKINHLHIQWKKKLGFIHILSYPDSTGWGRLPESQIT